MQVTNQYYTGVGSRRTSVDMCKFLTKIAETLARCNYILRSGGANGADLAFEIGCKDVKLKEIYLPWRGFNHNTSELFPPTKQAFDLMDELFPSLVNAPTFLRSLTARNVHQVVGYDVDNPIRSSFLVCWTDGGRKEGGTGRTIRIAEHFEVPVINLGKVGYVEARQRIASIINVEGLS